MLVVLCYHVEIGIINLPVSGSVFAMEYQDQAANGSERPVAAYAHVVSASVLICRSLTVSKILFNAP